MPYLDEVNCHMAASAADKGIPHAEVRLGGEGMSSDGAHPNDHGYGVIADRLRELGYEPLGLRRATHPAPSGRGRDLPRGASATAGG